MKLNLMTMITGSALVAVLWVNPGMTFDLPGCAGFMQTDDAAAICYDDEKAEAEQAVKDAQAPMQILLAQGDRTCTEPDAWPAGRIATWAVMKMLDGEIVGLPFDRAWALASAGDAWTLRLCEEVGP